MDKIIYKILHIFRYLSLDVCAGALASGMMAAHVLHVAMPLLWYYILPAAVWVVYTLDHLLDAQRIGIAAHTPRHAFHWQHRQVLWRVWGVVATSCVAAFWLPNSIIVGGIGIGALVGMHLLLVAWVRHRTSLLLIKEIGVGVIYSLGIWLPPLMLPSPWRAAHPEWIVFAGQFFLLVMLNLFVFSLYDLRSDILDKQSSFLQAIGSRWGKRLILAIGTLIIGISIFFIDKNIFIQIIYFIMTLILLWIAFSPATFRPHERFRAVGDGIFLLPFLIVYTPLSG